MNNTIPTLYILVGPPGSGKSHWASQNCKSLDFQTFSSDSYRLKLLGDENNQSNNSLIFSCLYRDAKASLSQGKNVCIDATNICKKERARVLSQFKGIECKKVAVVICTSMETCKKQNGQRCRVVPEFVIDKFFNKYEKPDIKEGFDEIINV